MACNWVSGCGGIAQTAGGLVNNLMQMGAAALETSAKQAQLGGSIMNSISKQASLESQAKAFRKGAEDAVKEAGRAQEQGRMQRESRTIALGNQKAAINASAAGSGIDVSSRTVQKTVSDTVKSAYNDMEVMADNEKQAVQERINQKSSMEQNAIWAESNAKQEQINEKMMFKQMQINADALEIQQAAGIFNTVAGVVGGVANIGNSFMGG